MHFVDNDDLRSWLGDEGSELERYTRGIGQHVMRDGFLNKVPFDLDSLSVTGPIQPVAEDVGGDRSSGAYYFDITDNGHLFHAPAREEQLSRNLMWVERDGAQTVEPA